MKPHQEFAPDLSDFSGNAPLFPLSEVVLFPHVALPLHIFEPRYRQMVADVLEEDRLIALALPQRGWSPQDDRDDRPPIHEMVCLGRITAEERLDSGRYNIVLTGIHRAVVVAELATDLPYRTARLELYRDFYTAEPLAPPETRRRELLLAFRRLFPNCRGDSLFAQALEADLPLGVLTDLLSAALRIDAREKIALLEELDVDLRCDLLLDKMRSLQPPRTEARGPVRFPPEFSRN